MLPLELYGRSRDRAATDGAYYASFFAGADNGFLFYGPESTITKTGGAAAANGDPIASVVDLQDGTQSVSQGTAGNQPTLIVTNGVPAIGYGNTKVLTGTLNGSVGAAHTLIYVIYSATNVAAWFPYVFDDAGLDYVVWDGGGTFEVRRNNVAKMSTTLATGAHVIVETNDGSDIAGTFKARRYNLAGALQETLNGQGPEALGAVLNFGYASNVREAEMAMYLCINKVLSESDISAIIARIAAGPLAGWH